MNVKIVLYEDILSGNTQIETLDSTVLYLCDHQSIIDDLQNRGMAVAGLIHDQNRGIFFNNVSYVVEQVDEMRSEDFLKIYQRIRKIPWTILETQRLLVRESTIEDVDDFYVIYQDERITQYTENLFEDPDEERAYQQDYIKNIYEFYGYGIWTIIDKETSAVIGRAGIAPREGYEIPELGFVIGEKWQNKGYATEVCEAILNYALEELEFEQIMAIVHVENRASQCLCEKLGFVRSGELHDDCHEIWLRNLIHF